MTTSIKTMPKFSCCYLANTDLFAYGAIVVINRFRWYSDEWLFMFLTATFGEKFSMQQSSW